MKQQGAGWKRLPFVKLLLALSGGILIEYYYPLPGVFWKLAGISFVCILLSVFYFPFFRRYQLPALAGSAALLLMTCLGGWLARERDITAEKNWIGNFTGTGYLLARVEEPPSEKTNSFRLAASLEKLVAGSRSFPVRGNIIIYLKKDTAGLAGLPLPGYGARLVFKNRLSPISGQGNPGGFDYGRYCSLKGITHQVFLDQQDYIRLESTGENKFKAFIFSLRERIVRLLRTYIKGDKERGLAEALLIGYRNDLDKSLVKAYADAGVVHIIAISGLHIGLIYWLLAFVFQPLTRSGYSRLAAVLMIGGLWLFSFLAGAQPSILRAALMFSCLIIEKQVSGKSSTYNTIAFSAFVLLCIDPFWLFDAGFQLSYAAVISIISFMKPVYNLIYIKHKWLDPIWKMNAVTISAQVLTLPLCLYYFHQFPNYFLFTNFVAVPVSSVILLAEILLLVISFIPFLASATGTVINLLIGFMNGWVEFFAGFPHATWGSLYISVMQCLLLAIGCGGLCLGIIEKSRHLLRAASISLLAFFTLRAFSFFRAYSQELIVVYNVPQHTAIDLVRGREYIFIGDSEILSTGPKRELYLEASRTYFRTSGANGEPLDSAGKIFSFGGKKIWIPGKTPAGRNISTNLELDLLILSGNPRIYLKELAKKVKIGTVVFDGSIPAWKSRYWKKDCDSLGIPWHDVTLQGAFVMNTR